MGVRWTRVTLEDRQRKLRQAIATLPEGRKYMEYIAEQGAQEMQAYITERGTEYSAYRQARGIGGRGRVETGSMLDDVSYRTVSQSAGVINAEFGWIEDFQQYYSFQEKGTRYIKAMHALFDSSQNARDQLQRAGDQIIADLARKLN